MIYLMRRDREFSSDDVKWTLTPQSARERIFNFIEDNAIFLFVLGFSLLGLMALFFQV